MFWARHSWIFNPRCSLNSMTTSLRMSRLLGKCAKDSSLFSSSFHPLGLHAVALCPAFPLFGAPQSQVHPILVSTLSGLCRALLFAALPNGAPALRRDAPFCSAGPLGAPQFPCGSGSSATRVLLCASSQFPSASSLLSPCSLGCEALVSSSLCQVEFSSCFQQREIHLTHPWCR